MAERASRLSKGKPQRLAHKKITRIAGLVLEIPIMMRYQYSKRLRKRLRVKVHLRKEDAMRRKTSSLERYMLFFGRQFPLNFGFQVTISGTLNPDKARSALVDLSKRHSILFAHQEYTVGKQMDLVFDRVPDFPITERTESGAWQDILLSCMIREFNPFTGPLFSLDWRATGGKTELFFVFQHGASDGIAATYFIDDFLKLYAGLPVRIPESPALPNLYDVLDETLYAELLTRPEPDWKKEEPPAPKPFEMPKYKAPEFYLRTFKLAEEGTARLASRAKEAGQTVHSWLGALIMKESAAIFGPESGMNRTIQCPVDFRQYLKEEWRPIAGVYNGIVKAKLDCEKPLHEMATAIKEGIQASRAGAKDIEDYFHFRDSFDGVEDPESLMMSFPPDPLDYDFSFSNLGRTVVAGTYGDVAVGEFYGPIFTSVNGETVIGLNTTAGVLRMSLIFDRTIENAKKYEALGDRIEAVLAGL